MRIADPEAMERFSAQTLDKQIIKRLEQVGDLTGPVVFMTSDAGNFITGQSINVDGGPFINL
jgi:NAD(P)-dependent dehydrogenase (short-subunit alcohol dehydrogenase family)